MRQWVSFYRYRDPDAAIINYGDSDFDQVEGVAVAGSSMYVAHWRLFEHQGEDARDVRVSVVRCVITSKWCTPILQQEFVVFGYLRKP